MISDELRAEIRRLYFAEHWKVGTISAQLRVHHDTVSGAIEHHRFVNRGCAHTTRLIGPYQSFIEATLDKYPKLIATRLFDMLEPRGFQGSIFQLRRYLRVARPVSRREAFFRLTFLPGEQGQVDWGSFGTIRIGRALRKLCCFVLRLCFCRLFFARFFLDQALETFLRAHHLAFEFLGGVTRNLAYDNLKTAVLERQGDLIRFHPRLLEAAGHYHFAPVPCAVARGNEKGRVESAIKFIRYSFFPGREFSSVEELNRQLDEWIERRVLTRPVPDDPDGRTVRQAWEQEKPRLLPLPKHPFPTDLVKPIASGKTPYVRFDKNDYSIPHTLIQKPLTLVASESLVRVVDAAGNDVACHERTYDKGRQIEDKSHLDGLAKEKTHARELRGRNRLTSACTHALAFLADIALSGGPLGGTTARLLRLLDRHGAVALDDAIGEAHSRGALSAHAVAHILDQRLRQTGTAPPLEVGEHDDPRVCEAPPAPHDLASYDALGRVENEGGHHGQS